MPQKAFDAERRENVMKELSQNTRRTGRRRRGFTLICFAATTFAVVATASAQGATRPSARGNSSKQPLRFEANHGQTSREVKYLARAADYNIFLSNDEADVVLHSEMRPAGPLARGKVIVVRAYASVLRMRFANSNPPTKIVPLRQRSPMGASAPEPYTAVAYRGIYAGTDIVFHGDQRRIGLELNLSPGADPRDIMLSLDGATGIFLDSQGNAVVRVGDVSLVLQRPSVFEVRNGRRRPVSGSYRIEPNNRLRFMVGLPSANEQIITD